MSEQIVIWGAGGHALVVADALLASGETLIGFIDTVNAVHFGASLLGLPVWPSYEEARLSRGCQNVVVALGFGHCAARMLLINRLAAISVSLKTVVHPSAVISPSARLGKGVYVAPNAIIESGSSIGDGVIVNASSVICHETSVGPAAAICPNVSIGGKTQIGEMSWIGIGSTVIDKVCIGRRCYVGAGSVVVNNLPDDILAYGVPARVRRANEATF